MTPRARADERNVALLRGINLGGINMLPMKDLAAMFTDAGCRDVETYIQSGNVVFTAPSALLRKLPRLIPQAIERDLGLRVPLVVRTASELARVVLENPFQDRGVDPRALHVVFLADVPSAAALASLDPGRSPPDELVAVGPHVYLCCPNGVARSKLTNAYFDSTLRTTSTARNWRTVTKLLELARR